MLPQMTAAERQKAINALIAKQNKAAERKVLGLADELIDRSAYRRPSGIMPLDIHTAGGLPWSCACYISGPDGVGKTYLLYRYMYMNQRLYGANSAIAIAPVEHPFDHIYCRKQGLMVAVPDDRIEQEQIFRKQMGLPALDKPAIKYLKTGIGTVMPIVANTMEELLDQVLASVRTNAFQIIGIDSITGAIPADLDDKDLDENTMRGRHAKILTDFYRKYAPYSNGYVGDDSKHSDTTIIMTQQVRSNPAKEKAMAHIASRMRDWDGGGTSCASKHGKLIEITVTQGEKIKKTVGGKEVQIGKAFKWEITKGKKGCHEGLCGEATFLFEGGINLLDTVMLEGIKYGVLYEKDGKFHIMDTLTKKPHPKYPALPRPEFIKFLFDNLEAEEFVRKSITYLARDECVCLYR